MPSALSSRRAERLEIGKRGREPRHAFFSPESDYPAGCVTPGHTISRRIIRMRRILRTRLRDHGNLTRLRGRRRYSESHASEATDAGAADTIEEQFVPETPRKEPQGHFPVREVIHNGADGAVAAPDNQQLMTASDGFPDHLWKTRRIADRIRSGHPNAAGRQEVHRPKEQPLALARIRVDDQHGCPLHPDNTLKIVFDDDAHYYFHVIIERIGRGYRQ